MEKVLLGSTDASCDVARRLELLDAEFKSYLLRIVDKIDQPSPHDFIHYTKVCNAKKILASKIIRASDIFSMNDQHEISYGVKVLGTRLQSRTHTPKEIRELFRPVKEGELNAFMEKAREWPIYITCFSTNRYLASQWKDYADKGCGVAIVFDREQLCACVNVQAIGDCAPFPIVYQEPIQWEVADRVAQMSEVHAAGLHGSEQKTKYWAVAFSNFAVASFRFKVKERASEDEWRLFWLNPRTTPNSYQRDGKDVNYIEVPFPSTVVTEVVLGPSMDASTQREIQDFLSSCEGYGHIKITRSTVKEGQLLSA
jgi:hypothetical protein